VAVLLDESMKNCYPSVNTPGQRCSAHCKQ
jgi:hypothetical protein